jgi:hypothetical protein
LLSKSRISSGFSEDTFTGSGEGLGVASLEIVAELGSPEEETFSDPAFPVSSSGAACLDSLSDADLREDFFDVGCLDDFFAAARSEDFLRVFAWDDFFEVRVDDFSEVRVDDFSEAVWANTSEGATIIPKVSPRHNEDAATREKSRTALRRR